MTQEPDIEAIAGNLSAARERLVIASEPDDITGEEGCGVPIRGAAYRVARALEAQGLGFYSLGSPYGDMYWNNAFGLALRSHLLKGQRP